MPFMFMTLEVSKVDRSSNASELQPENMRFTLLTFDVSRPDRSSASSFAQSENI